MLENLIEFFSFSNINVLYVVLGTVLIGASTAVVGCFSVLRKRSLIGDAIAHSVLPGICMAFILFDTKNPLVLLLGAFITGWLSIIVIDFIVSNSRIKSDAAIGLVLSVFFGTGILMLTYIQHSGNAAQSGLDRFLFGKAAAIVGDDLIIFSAMSILLVLTVIFFFREFKFISFDPDFAQSIGMPTRRYEVLLSSITVLAITVGIQAVGVVLIAALLITPAVAARYWTDDLRIMIVIAALIGAVSNIGGAFISYSAPSMPTGPWIIVFMLLLAMLSIFFAPQKGLFFKRRRQQNNFKKILEENVMKLMYQLDEKDGGFDKFRPLSELMNKRDMGEKMMLNALSRLKQQKMVEEKKKTWILTKEGLKEGKRMVRLHRLWEVYLTEYLYLPSDHVHETAEAMEHVITPELERELDNLLNHPEYDPHFSKIPYD